MRGPLEAQLITRSLGFFYAFRYDPVCNQIAHDTESIMSVVKLGSGRWRLQIRRKTLKVDELHDSEEQARAAEASYLGAHRETGQGFTLRQLWARYEGSEMFAEKAGHTQRTERLRIVPVLATLGDCKAVELEADPGPIYDYIEARRKVISERTGKKLSGTSRRLELAALSSVIAYAKQRRIVRENFVSSISRPATGKRKKRVTPIEQGKLAAYARNSDPFVAQAARFLLLIRHLGCRPGELVSLRVDDVHLERSELLFRDTKNGLDRRVHVTSDAAQLLHLQLPDVPEKCPRVFFTWSSKKRAWVPYNYSSGVKRLRELGVITPEMHAQAGRREFVSSAIEHGTPILTIKKQTGHKSTQALEIYDEGLSTAPGVRDEIDRLAAAVRDENFISNFDAAGITPEQREKLLASIGKSQWVAPFKR